MIKDYDFLRKLDQEKKRTMYARITSLTWDENPIEYIEGRITNGSINIDGSSALRRTCSLSLIAQDLDINSYFWSLNTKIRLEVGIKNNIDQSYPDIIWFPQGTYILTSFNTSINANNYTVSLQGKDKMCMLNGDIGGSLSSSIDFGVEEYIDLATNDITYNHIPIKDIIKNAVHVYGNEPLHNIIINDIDDYGYELLDYRGSEDTPLYLFKEVSSDVYANMTMNGNMECYYQDKSGKWATDEKGNLLSTKISDSEKINYDLRINTEEIYQGTFIKFKDSDIIYTIHKITGGETVGYRLTELTYAGELISNIGESLTSILDKIKNMLGNFEYFYDIDGRFIFQRKKTYVENNWNNLIDGEYVIPSVYASSLAYEFNDLALFTSFSHNPTINNLKNDFSVWGERETISGVSVPVHMRIALDYKPVKYTTIGMSENEATKIKEEYGFDALKVQESKTYTSDEYDWREIIYRMALDYFAYNKLDNFLSKVAAANKAVAAEDEDLYPLGYTGYESYYTDLQGFWRQLYNPEVRAEIKAEDTKQDPPLVKPDISTQYYIKTNELYKPVNFSDISSIESVKVGETYYDGSGAQYINLEEFNPNNEYYTKKDGTLIQYNIYRFKPTEQNYYYLTDTSFDINSFWNKDVIEDPASLNFWFDFIGEGSGLMNYMVPAIGNRTKVVNDNQVKAVYFKETPDVLFISDKEYEAMGDQGIQSGYTYIRINDTLTNMFNVSSQGKSAQTVIEELLYQNTYCIEAVSINSVPIFYLDANSRISIKDTRTKINGEYIVSRISIPLTYNGMMSITATKAADTLY